jgi:hypothetical protein
MGTVPGAQVISGICPRQNAPQPDGRASVFLPVVGTEDQKCGEPDRDGARAVPTSRFSSGQRMTAGGTTSSVLYAARCAARGQQSVEHSAAGRG